MKKSSLLLVLFSALMFSCQNSNESSEDPVDIQVEEVLNEVEPEAPIKIRPEEAAANNSFRNSTYFTGDFIAKDYKDNTEYTWLNKITIALDTIVGDSIYGRSIVAGNYRPFVGVVWDKSDGTKGVIAREPGDDKYDGTFTFIIENNLVVRGEWESYDPSLLVTKRKYNLEERTFVYNPENNLDDLMDFIDLGKYRDVVHEFEDEKYFDREIATISGDAYYYNASSKLLNEEDVANMKKGDLQIIRNTIYARHGYSFKNKIYRTIFDNGGLEWYMPYSVDVSNELTEIEKKNIALIKRYEDYAEEYYDTFGR